MPELTVERSSPVIRLGINVPNFGPQTDARALLSWTRFAESNGFAAVVLSTTWPRPARSPRFTRRRSMTR